MAARGFEQASQLPESEPSVVSRSNDANRTLVLPAFKKAIVVLIVSVSELKQLWSASASPSHVTTIVGTCRSELAHTRLTLAGIIVYVSFRETEREKGQKDCHHSPGFSYQVTSLPSESHVDANEL